MTDENNIIIDEKAMILGTSRNENPRHGRFSRLRHDTHIP